jgi:hypothetical protein
MMQLVVTDEEFNPIDIGVDGGHGITLSEHLLINTSKKW